MDALVQILIGVMIAVISSIMTAIITFHISLKKFRSEKQWELKVISYQKIIEALHNSKRFCEEHFDAEIEAKKLSEDFQNELRIKASQAHDEILKAIDVGAFLISNKAVERLKKYRTESVQADKADSWFMYLDESYGLTKSCLEDILILAKKDVNI